jgi:hypothetical protein
MNYVSPIPQFVKDETIIPSKSKGSGLHITRISSPLMGEGEDECESPE